MRAVKYLTIISMVLGGCVVGPEYTGPPDLGRAAPPSSFVRQVPGVHDSAPPLANWWTSLNDRTLDSLVRRALTASPSMDAAHSRIRQARASVRQERAARWPTVAGQTVGVFADLPGVGLRSVAGSAAASALATDEDITLRFYNFGLNANWEIDLAGGHARKVEASEALASAAAFGAADALLQLTAEMAQAYANLRERQQRTTVLRRSLEIQRQVLELTEQRFRHGTVPSFSVAPAARAVEETSAQLAASEAEHEMYLNVLAVLTGAAPGALDELLSPTGDIPIPPESVAVGDPADLLRRRPDIRAAERTLAAATARIGVAEAGRFPKIRFIGVLGIGGTSISDLVELGNVSRIALPQLQWNLVDFGRTSSTVGQAHAAQQEAEANYRLAILTALQDAESSLSRFRQQKRTVAALAEIKRSADHTAGLTKQRYEAGVASRIDYLEAERQLLTASANLHAALAALTGSYIAVQKSLGLGWIAPASESHHSPRD